jgi:hypothetical protein
MTSQSKHFKKVTLEVPLFKNTKGTFFFPLMLLICRRASNKILNFKNKIMD